MGISPLRSAGLAAVAAVMLSACGGPQGESHDDASNTTVVLRGPQRTVPDFTGVDEQGRPFHASSMKGGYWLASFFFTSCESVCPALNTVQAGLQREFGSKIRFVSVTTDPENDTPDRLHAYAEQYGARSGRWTFVRMTTDSMRALAVRGFAVMEPTDPSMHSTRFVLVDDSMRVRDYFDSADSAEVVRLKTVIRGL